MIYLKFYVKVRFLKFYTFCESELHGENFKAFGLFLAMHFNGK